jgi:hypothetical protein
VVLLGAVSFLGAQAWQDLPVTECGDNHLAPLKVQIEEMPVKAGGKLSLQLSFTPDRDITGGKVKVGRGFLTEVTQMTGRMARMTKTVCSRWTPSWSSWTCPSGA